MGENLTEARGSSGDAHDMLDKTSGGINDVAKKVLRFLKGNIGVHRGDRC